MKMSGAIAFSHSNKAQILTDEGAQVVVQERYNGQGASWLHVWVIQEGNVVEFDVTYPLEDDELREAYSIDPAAGYWGSI